MTELLIQSGTAATQSQKVADEILQIRQGCQADHGDKPLVECPGCFEKALEAVRSRYLNSLQNEWFKSRTGFLQEIDAMFAEVKEYRLDPSAIDDRIKEEMIAWYAENVRASLLRLMVEDPVRREAVLEKLEEPPSDITHLAREIATIFSSEDMHPELNLASVPDCLASAVDQESRLKVLKQAFFTPGGNSSGVANPDQHEKYFRMVKENNLPMDQVVDRILEDRQAAIGAREQSDKLRSRLDELRRARARHEFEKRKKAKNQASSVENTVPDELYKLPPCAVCGEAPSTVDFLCCPVCAILVWREVNEQHTVYCTPECRDKGYQSHIETAHTCSAKEQCIQLRDEDTIMEDGTCSSSNNNNNSKIYFCAECLSSLKQPTLWCSLACADRNFQDHRETVHVPQRKRLGLDISDEDQLVYDNPQQRTGGQQKPPAAVASGGATAGGGEEQQEAPPAPAKSALYHAKDIASQVVPFEMAVAGWEEQNSVQLGL